MLKIGIVLCKNTQTELVQWTTKIASESREVTLITKRVLLLILLTFACVATAGNAGVIEGIVYLSAGGPVAAGVDVKVSFRPEWDTVADDSGHFVFPDVMAGQWNVVCRPPGYLPALETVSVGENDTVHVELVLRSRGGPGSTSSALATLSVHVVGGSRGVALRNCEVTLAGATRRTLRTNSRGVATFSDLPQGEYTLTAVHTAYGRVSKTVTIPPGGIELNEYLTFFQPSDGPSGNQ